MPSKIDIYRSAKMLIDRLGTKAQEHALAEFDRFIALEDVAGASTWLSIAHAIDTLTNTNSSVNQTMH